MQILLKGKIYYLQSHSLLSCKHRFGHHALHNKNVPVRFFEKLFLLDLVGHILMHSFVRGTTLTEVSFTYFHSKAGSCIVMWRT